MSLLPAVVAVATCLPLVVRTALALSSFCHTSYVGRGAELKKAEAQSEQPKNFAPRPRAWNSRQKSRGND